ncbi:MAG: sigma-70 family RNA polymerase sigma factor [Solirubrobacteraceae bacterium]
MGAVTAPPAAAPRFARLLRSMPDGRLVARVRAGDERAFEVIFDRYHRQLLAFCRHMLGSREEAEDALQHAFVSAHRSLVSGDAGKVVELRPWLYAIARNRCLSVLRARRESVALDDVPEPSAEGLAVAAEVEQREDLKDVLADMARLPDDQRAALVLSELGALSHDEVAAVLDVRKDKVKALVFQARESLAGWRTARDTDCRDIREQLATLTGGALRRAPLRRHLETCDDCRSFRGEVRRQREAVALLLPVIPTIALKAKVVGAIAASVHAAPAAGVGAGLAGAGVTAGVEAAGTGGGLAALGGGLAGKALVVAAIAGTAGGGYAVVKDQTSKSATTPVVRERTTQGSTATPTTTSAAARPTPVPATTSTTTTSAQAKSPAAAKKPHGQAKKRPSASVAKGRPAVPGVRGLQHAANAQGLQHRPATPPGQSSGKGKGKATGQVQSSVKPGKTVKPKNVKAPKVKAPKAKTTPPVVTPPEDSSVDDDAEPAITTPSNSGRSGSNPADDIIAKIKTKKSG